ncbi:RNA recognition motif [Popillia japonica]|uniref:RNA recognition motif n=1 Tax=Popillia japonica TaxID=7064 RepID=A0AAW1IXH3_POPJA
MSINLEPTFLLKALWVVYTRGFAAFLEFHFSESCCALFKYLQLSFNVFSSTLIPTCEGHRMVMEAPPSPDSVGREFVRQYYTLLNKAPAHLHRFYNNQSSFVHGGLDPPNRETSPMIGQKQIHQKIQQLNFRDCHAKIAQVDAQATLGNGPMRRFTQTFVLAAQSPKKYYVHNDIFRYQDEIISEEDCEPESRSDVEDEISQERPEISQERPTLGDMPPINQQPEPPYYSPNAAPIQGTMPQVPPPHHHAQPPQHVLPPQPQPVPVPTVNGAIHPDEMNVMPQADFAAAQVSPHVTSTQPAPVMGTPLSNLQPAMAQIPIVVPISVDERPQQQQPIDEGAGDAPSENIYPDEPIPDDPQEVVPEPAAISNEPKTYATLLKSSNTVSNFSGSSQISTMSVQQQPSTSPPPSSNHFDSREMTPNQAPNSALPLGQRNSLNRNNNARGNQVRPPRQDSNSLNRNNNARGNQVRPPRQDSRGGPGRLSLNEDDGRRLQGTAHGDNFQLFLGNLPHFATEEELREIFSEFGQIVDLRIHSKPNNKTGQPGRAPPNYGFITYETQQGVQNCLAAKPHFFPKNERNGHQLNVEEKKTKDRPFGSGGGGGGRPGGDNNGGPRPRDNGQRRSGPGGTGVNRGGGVGGPGIPGGQGNRPNSFNRGGGGGPPNRGPNNTYNNRR